MKELLTVIAENTIMIIHAMALVIISIGTIQAFLLSLRTIFNPSPIGNHFHYIYSVSYTHLTLPTICSV